MLGLIANNNESARRKEFEELAVWGNNQNLACNIKKTKENKSLKRAFCCLVLTNLTQKVLDLTEAAVIKEVWL